MTETFETYLQAEGKSKSTIQCYYTHAIYFISWLDKDQTEVENTTAKEVLAYLSHLQKQGESNATRNLKLNAIKHFFNYQVRHGHRSDNPVQHLKLKGIKRQKLYPILSKQDLAQLYSQYMVPSSENENSHKKWFTHYQWSRQRNKAMLGLMIHQGLTTAEVNSMEHNDLNLREGTIYIAGSRKSNERTLELKSSQMLELMEYHYQLRPKLLGYQQDPTINYLFLAIPVPLNRKAKASDKTGVPRLEIWKRLSKELKAHDLPSGNTFINFKQVRTSVITHWLKHYNLREVQYRAGHRYISSTEKYKQNDLEGLQEEINRFHPLG